MGPFVLDSDVNSDLIENVSNNFTNRAQFLDDYSTVLGWVGGDDDIELFQVIGTDTPTAVELEMIKHDGDADNVEENADRHFPQHYQRRRHV